VTAAGLGGHSAGEALARAAGDSTWLGIAKVWEALTIGPRRPVGRYSLSQVDTSATNPRRRPVAILSALQTLLTKRSPSSRAARAPGRYPDLIFNPLGDQTAAGQRAKWIRAAWTLKARYFMHTPSHWGYPPNTAAIAAAINGINDASGNGDFRCSTRRSPPSATCGTSSNHVRFGADLERAVLGDYMNARNDPRRAPTSA